VRVRLVLYTGKGGVGKTTTAAAAAVCAARRGTRTLVASADAAHSLGDVLERRLGAEPQEVAPALDAVEIDARVEVAKHWGRIQDYLVATFLYHGVEGVVAEELAMLPGAEELVTLMAVERIAASGAYAHVVIDCAPTDGALRLLTLPEVARGMLRFALPVLEAVSGVAVPLARRLTPVPLPDRDVFREAEELLTRRLTALARRLVDPRTSARLVVTPERMVIDEARRAWTELSLFEVPCDAVVCNRMLPDEAGELEFFRDWRRVQAERRREIEELFAPLPVLEAPLQDDEVTGLERLAAHGERLFGARAPDAVLCESARVRFERDGDGYLAIVPLPQADAQRLDVAKLDDDLVISTPARRRRVRLPRRYAALSLQEAKLAGGSLVVRFARATGAAEAR
jgi:arsenite-transporting ATPase